MPSLERPRVEYRTPEDLVREVKRGAIRIPQFQRSFKWEAPDIVRLFDSIRQGYPVGNLLLWQRPAPPQHVQIGPLTVTAPAMATALWVVDGQQRITSLVGALTSAHTPPTPGSAFTSISTPASSTPPAFVNSRRSHGSRSAFSWTPRPC